jgi:hypothetical protein
MIYIQKTATEDKSKKIKKGRHEGEGGREGRTL